jgi:S-adenosylmethionine hydrolase
VAGSTGARLVTLSTDIGAVYAAQMKAVLLRYVAPGQVIELTHELPAHQVGEAAFLLRHMAGGFPKGTVHVAVVDPGVGGARAPVAVRCRDGSHLVGPDNGVLGPLSDHLGVAKVVRLRPELVRPGAAVSPTFEGRDLFAPAAGRIAQGTPVGRLGDPWKLRRYRIPRPRRLDRGAQGVVLHVDHFGNLITNLPSSWGPALGTEIRVRLAGRARRLRRYRTYEEMPASGAGVLASSFGVLELSVRERRAADRLRASVGDALELTWSRRREDRK